MRNRMQLYINKAIAANFVQFRDNENIITTMEKREKLNLLIETENILSLILFYMSNEYKD